MSSAFSPLAVIDNELMSLFTTGKAVDSEMHLTQLFDHLDDDDIPYLTLNAIKSGSFPANSLVRYRCLVQDMLDVEYYSSVFKTQHGGLLFSKYRDRIPQDIIYTYGKDVLDLGVIGERLPLVCVPIPGENDWANVKSTCSRSSGNSEDCSASSGDYSENSKKRRTCRSEEDSENHLCCLVKIYDNVCVGSAPQPVRLNDMLEVVGVYSADDTNELLGTATSCSGDEKSLPGLGGLEELLLEEDDMQELEGVSPEMQQERDYPSRTFPRLHCLRFRVLPASFPLLTSDDDKPSSNGHNMVVDSLQKVLLGDRLAAEYASLMLISRTGINSAQQNDMEAQNFGNLSLNLYNAVSDDTSPDVRIDRLRAFLKHLLPRSSTVEVSVDSLNSSPLFVRKSEKSGRTEQSRLQLGAGTALVLDETLMGEGDLGADGLKNLRALKRLLNDHKLLVECSYYDLQVPVDLTSIIFSTPTSVLSTPTTMGVPLEANSAQLESDEEVLDLDQLGAMRAWWAGCRELPKPSMDEEVVQAAERDFLAARKSSLAEESVQVGSSELHRWILTAQLLALAVGAHSVSLTHWERMRALENDLLLRRTGGVA